MEQQESVSLKIQLDMTQLPAAEKEAKASVRRMYEDQNQQAKEANERAKRYAEEYAAFWLRAMDKIDRRESDAVSKRQRVESQYSAWWNRELDARDRREESSRKRAAREVEAINAQTRRQAKENADFHEQMAQRMSQATQRAQTTQAKWNATDFIRSIGGSGGGGGNINSILSGLMGGGGGGGGGSPGSAVAAGAAAGAVAGIIITALEAIKSAALSALQTISGLLQQGARAWFEYAAHMQQVRIGFDTLLGSAEKAHVMLGELEKLAVRSPFQFEDLAEGARRLIAMGTAAENVNGLMTAIGNSVAAIGGRAAEFQRVVYAIGDIQAKGKLTGEEVRQLANNAVPVMKILGEATGKTSAELRKMIEQGKISSDFFVDAFTRYSEIHFGDAMDKQARTFLGALSNIEDGLKQKAERMFAPLFDKISELTAVFGDIFSGDGDLMTSLMSASEEFTRVGTAIGLAIADGLQDPRVAGTFLAVLSSIVPTPEKIVNAAIEAGINKAVSGNYYIPNTSPGDVPLGNPSPQPWKPQPFGAPVDPLEAQQRKEAIDAFAKLTGGDGEKAMERYLTQSKALTDQIENFNAKTHEQQARLSLLRVGFKDLNDELAQNVIHKARQLDQMETERRETEKLQRLKERFGEQVEDAVRGANQKTLDLQARDASNLSEFEANLALKLRDAGEKAKVSSKDIEAALDRIRAAMRQLDDAQNVKSATDEFLRIQKAIDQLNLKIGNTDAASEMFFNFLNSSGLAAAYAAGENEALVGTLNALKSAYEELVKKQKEWQSVQNYKTAVKQTIDGVEQLTESLKKQLDEFDRADDATPLEKYIDGLKHLKNFKLSDEGASRLKDYFKNIETLDTRPGGEFSWLAVEKIVNTLALLSKGFNENDAVKFATDVTNGLKLALEANKKLNPLEERRKQLNEEFIKGQRDVGIEAALSAERYRNAWQSAIDDIQMRDLRASEERARAQVEIGDKTVFHSEQFRAQFEKHVASMKGYTDIVADAFIGASDAIGNAFSKLFGKVTKGLGDFGKILNDIATNLFKMVSNRLLMRLVDGLFGGSGGSGGFSVGGSGGGAGGFSIGQIFGGIFNRGSGPGGTPLFNGGSPAFLAGGSGVASVFGSQYAGLFRAAGGSQIGTADTFSGQQQSQMSWRSFLSGKPGGLFEGFVQPGGGLSNAGGFMALMAHVGITNALFGNNTKAALGKLGFLSPFLSSPFIAGFPLFGLLQVVGRNKLRREEEKVRNQAILDAKGQIDELIRQVRNHRTDPMSALSQASDIRAKYMSDMSQLKDKKTRNHALLTVREIDYKIGQLRSAASGALNDANRANITAAFATGGVVPGQRGEPRLVLAHGGEIISGLAHQTPAFVQAAADAGIPGVRGSGGGGAGRNVNLNVELHVGTETRDKLVVDGMESEAGYNVNVKQTRKALKYDL